MFSQQKSYSILTKKIKHFPKTLIILGSGWNKIINKSDIEIEIGYEELFDEKATVPGHEGKLIIANIKNKRVAFMSGRLHNYEGYSSYQSTQPIYLFSQAGIKQLISTSASGALNEKYKVGDFVILSDVITILLGHDNPLIGPKFMDMSEVFNKDLRENAVKQAVISNISFHEGIYLYVHGPHFETPADKMALKFLGGDVVGMSVVPEVLVAKSLNIDILGLSFVTNLAFVKHDHKEVVAEANKGSEKMKRLLLGLI